MKLTADFCKNAPKPEAGNRVFRCSATKGLGLRVTASGNRAFVFNYTTKGGRERRMTIGELGPWTFAAARVRALELRREVDGGADPMAEREDRRMQITLGEFWQEYSSSRLLQLSTASQRDQMSAWRRHIEPMIGKHTKLRDIRRVDVQRLVEKVGRLSGATSANRCHSYLRRMLNVAKAEGHLDENVAAEGIERHSEAARERYLSGAELDRLAKAISSNLSHPSTIAIGLLLLTGARRGEVLSMEWSHLDLERGIWVKPAKGTKQRRIHRVPLSISAIGLLSGAREISGRGQFVFPAEGKRGHLSDVKKTWARLCAVADIQETRLHDLRHTYASLLVSKGHSLSTIGKLLGHSQVQTTNRYAHLYDDVLRSATEAAGIDIKVGN